MRLPPSGRNGRNPNLFGLFYFHNPIKWDNVCNYECKFKTDIKRQFIHSAEKETKFNFKSGRCSLYACTFILSICTPSSYAQSLGKIFVNDIFFLYPKKPGYRKLSQAYHAFYFS